MKVLALDVGERRIGVAASDPLGIVAQGLTVVRRTDLPADLEAIQQLCLDNCAELVLVGFPLNMDGSEGPMARKIRGFADRLRDRLIGKGVEVELWDERLSTQTAEEILAERGVRWADRKEVVDQVAAAVILQEYLDTHVDAGSEPRGEGA